MHDDMRTKRPGKSLPSFGVRLLTFGCACALLNGMALAQYDSQGFELPLFTASPDGTLLTGQDGFYMPDGVDFYAYTYAGNVLGLPQNPQGGDQFVAGVGQDAPNYARAQRDMSWGGGEWVITYDVAAFYMGSPPGAQNLGSFSVQPYPGSSGYLQLFSWTNPDLAQNWQAFYMGYDAGGTAHPQPGMSPGPQWENLSLSHWYRFQTVIDFDLNRIIEVSMWDLTTGMTATYSPANWYLEGGAGGGVGEPTGFRFFAGGGVPGNGVAWDNFSIIPAPPAIALLGLGALARTRRR